MSEFTLSVNIEGDARDLVKASKEAGGAIQDLGDKVDETNTDLQNHEQSSQGASKALTDLAKKAGIATLVYKGFKVMSNAIKYNSVIEQYATSFEVMTGSAEQANSILQELKDLGASTPFELSDLADTTQLLMNYGFTADSAVDSLRMLGDISQGSADKMNRIGMAYGQMSSAGKVTLQDVKQMIEAGFNPLKEISQSTGESMESLYDRISKGTISVDEITESMKRSTSEGGLYFQSMDKQSKTLEGRMSTLRDVVANRLGKAFEGVSNFLRDKLIPGLTDLIENTDKYKDRIVILGIALGTITALFVAFKIQQIAAATSMTAWGVITAGATAITAGFGTALTFVLSPLGLIIIAIGAVIAIGYLLIKHWDIVKAFAGNTWNGITDIFNNFINFMKESFEKDWTESFGVFGIALNVFFAYVKSIWDSIVGVFNGVISFVKNVFSGNWSGAWQSVVDIFGSIFGGMVNIAKAPINGVIALVNKAIEFLNSIQVEIPDWIPIFGGQTWGLNFEPIPYLLHGTKNFAGGFARMNEGGRGELVHLPNGTQVIPHDVSMRYARESARVSASTSNFDMQGLGSYIIEAIQAYGDRLAGGVSEGISNIRLEADGRELARLLQEMGFIRA